MKLRLGTLAFLLIGLITLSWTNGCTSGLRAISGSASGSFLSLSTASQSLNVNENSRLIVMEYEGWFGPGAQHVSSLYNPLLSSSSMTNSNGQNTGYDSTDPAIIRQHIYWLEEMGVDAVTLDTSNGVSCAFGSDLSNCGSQAGKDQVVNIANNVSTIYSLYNNSKTRLKIVPLLGGAEVNEYQIGADGNSPFDRQVSFFANLISKYPNINIIYQGKPLLVVFMGAGQDTSPASPLALLKKAIQDKGWDSKFTFRFMAGYMDSQPNLWANPAPTNSPHMVNPVWQLWTWVDHLSPANNLFPSYAQIGSRTEAFTASGAVTGSNGWNSPDAALTDGGNTFNQFMSVANSLDPIFLFVHQFNEFQGPRGPNDEDEGPDQQHSADIEPTKQWGFTTYSPVKSALLNYRRQHSMGLPADHTTIGMVDGISADQTKIMGWTCSSLVATSAQVNVYVKGPAGSGIYIGQYPANLPSEAAVNQACQGGGSNYRFEIPLPSSLAQFAGQPIYIYGISAIGLEPQGISMGTVRVPGTVAQNPVLNGGSTPLSPTVLPAGFFRIDGTPAVFRSNGSGQWCGYTDIASFVADGGNLDESNATTIAASATSMMQQTGPCVVAPMAGGFFIISGSGTIYNSNGSGHFCSFSNSATFIADNGNGDLSNVRTVTGITYGMQNDGACSGPPMPAGFFRIADQPAVYNSNGQGHYCSFASGASFLAANGNADQSNVSVVTGIITGMMNDGTCQ